MELPAFTAAAVETTLKVEPGANRPWVAALVSGSPGVLVSAS